MSLIRDAQFMTDSPHYYISTHHESTINSSFTIYTLSPWYCWGKLDRDVHS